MEQYDVNRNSNRIVPRLLSDVFHGLSGGKKEVRMQLVAGLILLIAICLGKFHREIGLGLTAIGVDFYWFWLRTFLVRKAGTGFVPLMITGGFLIRILSLVAFIKLADYWLSPDAFRNFALMVLTIPIWNLLEAVILGKGKMT